jgi:hypothetical protein
VKLQRSKRFCQKRSVSRLNTCTRSSASRMILRLARIGYGSRENPIINCGPLMVGSRGTERSSRPERFLAEETRDEPQLGHIEFDGVVCFDQ